MYYCFLSRALHTDAGRVVAKNAMLKHVLRTHAFEYVHVQVMVLQSMLSFFTIIAPMCAVILHIFRCSKTHEKKV